MFLDGANWQYYIIYPPTFFEKYKLWWAERAAERPLGIVFTCLLLRICACSIQYVDKKTQLQLELELGEKPQVLTEKFHAAAEELSRSVLPGKGGIAHVQALLLGMMWYKCEAKFIDSWHALGTTIREAQELGSLPTCPASSSGSNMLTLNNNQGMHKSFFSPGLSEFEKEMRRRVWCMLYTWDWYAIPPSGQLREIL